MIGVVGRVLRWAPAVAVVLACGCGSPEAFHKNLDGSITTTGTGGNTFGSGGSTFGTGGSTFGTGGSTFGTGGSTFGTGGAATGGRGTGGSTFGTGGAATGGAGTGGAGTGGRGTGGTGTGGAGTGGASTGGRGTGGAGTGGSGVGGAGTGGSGAGGRGTGGSTGTGPCAGLCSNPVVFPMLTYHADLGTGATCHETMTSPQGGNCGNFVSPRTFSINGVVQTVCTGTGGNWPSLPVKKGGGYCFQATAGDYSYAYFGAF